ncbi:MAG: thiosulfate oxidation carrier protein SoxY, partial [Betaproteobacteria bacterium]|nr:thiosulfate oxidation carrier protein SoxY [Betaproteobacteria bacterium]
MDLLRRTILRGAGAGGAVAAAVAAGVLKPTGAWAMEWNKNAFEAKDMAGALKGLGASAT